MYQYGNGILQPPPGLPYPPQNIQSMPIFHARPGLTVPIVRHDNVSSAYSGVKQQIEPNVWLPGPSDVGLGKPPPVLKEISCEKSITENLESKGEEHRDCENSAWHAGQSAIIVAKDKKRQGVTFECSVPLEQCEKENASTEAPGSSSKPKSQNDIGKQRRNKPESKTRVITLKIGSGNYKRETRAKVDFGHRQFADITKLLKQEKRNNERSKVSESESDELFTDRSQSYDCDTLPKNRLETLYATYQTGAWKHDKSDASDLATSVSDGIESMSIVNTNKHNNASGMNQNAVEEQVYEEFIAACSQDGLVPEEVDLSSYMKEAQSYIAKAIISKYLYLVRVPFLFIFNYQ